MTFLLLSQENGYIDKISKQLLKSFGSITLVKRHHCLLMCLYQAMQMGTHLYVCYGILFDLSFHKYSVVIWNCSDSAGRRHWRCHYCNIAMITYSNLGQQ